MATLATCPDGAPKTLTCLTVAVPVDPTKGGGRTIALAVTVRRADASKWNAPVLSILGTTPSYPWTDPKAADVFQGHDLIWVDQRGAGRSDGGTTCPELTTYSAEISTMNLGTAAAAAVKACFAKAEQSVVPFASIFDHRVVAADTEVVRRALGISTWALYAGSAGADIALQIIDQDPTSVTAPVSRTPVAVGAGGGANDLAAAFGRFAADCAVAPKCSAAGDLQQELAKTFARLATPVTTKVIEPATGIPLVLDQTTLLDSMKSIGSISLSTLVASLLPGGVDGSSDEAVAKAFAANVIDTSGWALVMTDALGMGAVGLDLPEASIRAIQAGIDVVIFTETNKTASVIAALIGAVDTGRISEQRINEAALRVANVRHDIGAFCGPSH